jgi:parallel beta-helix repeat protein
MIYAPGFRFRYACATLLFFALLILPWLHPAPTVAASAGSVFYVSPSGDDAHPGTVALPWRTIQKAADTLSAGQTVYIRTGVYRERVIPQHAGSASAGPITYAAYPGDAPTLDGAGLAVPDDEGLFHIANQSHITVSGLRVQNSAYAGIYVDQAHHITVENCSAHNTASSGIGVWGSQNIVIAGNVVALACSNGMQESLTVAGTDTFIVRNNHVSNGPAAYRKEGICLKDGSAHGQVYQNVVERTAAVGIYVDAWDKHTHHIDVYQNTVRDVAAMGIALASETGGLLEQIRVFNNVVYHNELVGIWLSGCCLGPSHPLRHLQIVNNTLYDNGTVWGGGIALDNNPDIESTIIRNNLCSQNLSFQIAVDPRVPTTTLAIDHNLVDGYREGEGEVRGTEYVEAAPAFVSAVGADFRLLPTSPAIDRGTALAAPADDLAGHPRPVDGNRDGIAIHDIGAYEYTPGWVVLPLLIKSTPI